MVNAKDDTTLVDKLREKIKDLQKEREKAIFEKGLAAQFNGDLRENSEYDAWEQLETNLTTKIHNLMEDINNIVKPTTKKASKTVKSRIKQTKPKPNQKSKEDLRNELHEKHKWF